MYADCSVALLENLNRHMYKYEFTELLNQCEQLIAQCKVFLSILIKFLYKMKQSGTMTQNHANKSFGIRVKDA